MKEGKRKHSSVMRSTSLGARFGFKESQIKYAIVTQF